MSPVEQLAFDLEALDDTRVREFYSCGVHEQRRQVVQHWDECRKLVCPRCREVSVNAWMAEINHGSIECNAFCFAQVSHLNQVARCRLILDGEWPHRPQTNCYAHPHPERKQGAYWANGAPMTCVQAEFDNHRAWLLEHRVDENLIGKLGQYAHKQVSA